MKTVYELPRFEDRWERVRMLVPYEDGGKLSELYALGTPIEDREDTPDGVLVIARLPRRELTRFAPYLIAESDSTTRGWRGWCRPTRNGKPWLSRKLKATSSEAGRSSTRHRERRSNCGLQSDEEESDEGKDDRHRNRRAG